MSKAKDIVVRRGDKVHVLLVKPGIGRLDRARSLAQSKLDPDEYLSAQLRAHPRYAFRVGKSADGLAEWERELLSGSDPE